jgi:fengycin family lipopeptide synthetase D
MIPSHFMKIDRLPLTPSGKIDRKRLPGPKIEMKEETESSAVDEVKGKLTRLWSEILKIEKEMIDKDTSFFNMGGNSLRAVTLAAKIHKELGVNISLLEIFETPTINGLTGFIKRSGKEQYMVIEAVEMKEYYPLSSAQKRMYVLMQFDKTGVSYNIPQIVILEGQVDLKRLEGVFKALIRRHESFRTSFHMLEGHPVQGIHDDVEFHIDYGEVSEETGAAAIFRGFVRPFDLEAAPLLRVNLVGSASQRYYPDAGYASYYCGRHFVVDIDKRVYGVVRGAAFTPPAYSI